MEKIIYIGTVKVTIERPDLTPEERALRERGITQALVNFSKQNERRTTT